MARITITPLGFALGAEVTGLDLRRSLDDFARKEILDAWHKHLVLVFPRQDLDPGQQIAFSRNFGELEQNDFQPHYRDTEHPEILLVTNRRTDGEGMGDLALKVRSDGDAGSAVKPHAMRRRQAFAKARIFLPRVTWLETLADGPPVRRELDYESDVLAAIDWARFDATDLLADWAPAPLKAAGAADAAGTLDPHWIRLREPGELAPGSLNRLRLARALTDLVPNPWWVWTWIERVLARLLATFDEATLAAASAYMIERLRVDVERQRDQLAQERFATLVAAGRIEFALRADTQDYELPLEIAIELDGKPMPLIREDARAVERSLFEPFFANGLNALEGSFACYLDDRAAVEWWHRNVAKRHYGLQGWKRDKVYPDFVFAVLDGLDDGAARRRLVVLETKGAHLAGNEDTGYKKALLHHLSALYADKRGQRAGSLELTGGGGADTTVVCDLLVDTAWQGAFEARYFSQPRPDAA